MSEAWQRSPHDVDPLSWFSGPLVPVIFGGLAMTVGIAVTILMPGIGGVSWLEWASLALMFLGFISIGLLAKFSPSEKLPWLLLLPVLPGWGSVALSASEHIYGAPLIVELWWAPIGLAFLVAALAPYGSARDLLIVGSLSALANGTVIVITPVNRPGNWPIITEALIGTGSVIVATAAASVFAYQIVSRIQRWAATDPGHSLTSSALAESAKLRALRSETMRVAERTIPLLRGVAESGRITQGDRDRARVLAEEIRAELVERANRSWLDTLAMSMKLTILDAEHRADRMAPHQRAALLGLLQAATGGAIDERPTIVIQLRGEPDGATAVALSADVHFPEGRRVTLLAPHYFSLKTAVDDLEWDDSEQLRMRFRLPAGREPRTMRK